MCLSVKVHRPDDVLAEGLHEGFEWTVVHNTMGFRCGYVKVNPSHPWYGKDMDEIDCDVHGGLTFAEKDTPCDQGGPDNGWWIGFDCAHGGDAPDPTLPSRSSFRMPGGAVKTQTYVENECKSLCEQAKQALEV